MARDLIVVGGGEHARVVIEAARSRPTVWNVLGFLDPLPCLDTVRRLGVVRLGGDEEAVRYRDTAYFVLGVGTIGVSEVRPGVAGRLAGYRWATVVHADASVSPTASLGPGTVVFSHATINSGAVIEMHAVVNTGAIVEHDSRLGNFVQAGPGAAIGGGVSVGDGAYLGLGCRVRDHLSIGARATVGMGAVVVEDVAEGRTVVGVPAKAR